MKKNKTTIAADSYSMQQSAQNHADNVVMHGRQGHGFAAEKANHLADKFSGKQAELVGTDNAKYGADRLVDGVYIQTKYCQTGAKCISECFKNNRFKYLNADGSPMVIEVPSDKYESALRAMRQRIRKGEVSGVYDPVDAEKFVKAGAYTLQQVQNIAKFGTIESLKYDAKNGTVTAATCFGISATISFALAMWRGDNLKEALTQSCKAGLQTGGVAWAVQLISAQIGRTGIEQLLRMSTDSIAKTMGTRVANSVARSSGKALAGDAAINYVSKALRGNIIAGTVTTLVLSSADIARMFRGRISGGQLFKNVSQKASMVGGGYMGWSGGAILGASIGSAIPIIGTGIGATVGSILGSIAAGSAASYAASGILNSFIADDADQMLAIIQRQFLQLAQQYLLSHDEAELVIAELQQQPKLIYLLQDMYQSDDRDEFAQQLLTPLIEVQVQQRVIVLTSSSRVWAFMRNQSVKFAKKFALKISETAYYRDSEHWSRNKLLLPLIGRIDNSRYVVRSANQSEILKCIKLLCG